MTKITNTTGNLLGDVGQVHVCKYLQILLHRALLEEGLGLHNPHWGRQRPVKNIFCGELILLFVIFKHFDIKVF